MGREIIRQDASAPDILGSHADDAITFGRLLNDDGIGPKIRYGGPRNVLVFGPNGSGKGTRLLMPNLLQMTGRSVVVIDPKGELAAVTAPFRRTLGDVVIINPFGVLADKPGYEDLKSDGFNPLAALDPAKPSFNADAAFLADALIKIEGTDPHWDSSAQALVAATIMHVSIEARRSGSIPTLAQVRDLICEAMEKPAESNDFIGRGIPATAEKMMRTEIPGLKNKASQFADWTNEIRSIASAAKRQTESLDDDQIAADLSRGTFDFAEIKKRPVTVYLILPPDMMDRHSKWLRLVLTCALRSVLRAREPGEPKVLFMLDEFAALGHLQVIETVWALVRGYGVQIMPVLQDLNQLKAIYKERWETFIGNAGAVLALGANDLTTAKWMSERAGETTRVIAGYHSGSGHSTGGHGSTNSNEGLNWQQTKVPFVSPHKLFGLHDGVFFLWLAGLSDSVLGYAPGHFDIRQCKRRARDNPYHHGQ